MRLQGLLGSINGVPFQVGLQMTNAAFLPDARAERRAKQRAELELRTRVTPAMLHSIDSEGRLISVSDPWLAKLGYTREEVIGRRSSDFLTPDRARMRSRTYCPSSSERAAARTWNTKWCVRMGA